jgi:hypothetical protein
MLDKSSQFEAIHSIMRLAVAFGLVSSAANGQVSITPSDVTPGDTIKVNVLNEDGLGQSPGIPGIGFLGRGYDICK